jgi:predicted RNA binding protein YcfA (HicA-like mRNA interferase family)
MKVCNAIKKLETEGWFLSRIKGSHRQFKHSANPKLVTLPGKLSKDIPTGTLRDIFKKNE